MFEEDRKEKRMRDEQKKLIRKEMQGSVPVRKEEKPGQDSGEEGGEAGTGSDQDRGELNSD